ncbi:MAG: hypothetical protein KAH25_12845, partial [Bacteroidales bacterium]|nr:hypothetical protein [Bacteroidales bacterium]
MSYESPPGPPHYTINTIFDELKINLNNNKNCPIQWGHFNMKIFTKPRLLLILMALFGILISQAQQAQNPFLNDKDEILNKKNTNPNFLAYDLAREEARMEAKILELKEKLLKSKKEYPYRGQKANVIDSLALVALYNATDGDNWTNNINWLIGPVETWFGVITDADGNVIMIDLSSNYLSGIIPS